jgi:hypothetical protein
MQELVLGFALKNLKFDFKSSRFSLLEHSLSEPQSVDTRQTIQNHQAVAPPDECSLAAKAFSTPAVRFRPKPATSRRQRRRHRRQH